MCENDKTSERKFHDVPKEKKFLGTITMAKCKP